MRASQYSSSQQAQTPRGHFEDFDSIQSNSSALLKIFGAIALSVLVIAGISLATWSVNDPSITHATDAPVQNIFGFFGASVSDLLMQFFGLSVVAIIVPGIFISWRLFTHENLPRLVPHLWSWLLGSASATVVAACLPVFKNWPLPTGLGGIIGDAMLKLPTTLLGEHPVGASAALLILLCGTIATICLAHACFLIGNNGRIPTAESENFAPNLNHVGDVDDGPSTFGVIFGMLVHGFYVGRYHFGRLLKVLKALLITASKKLAAKSSELAQSSPQVASRSLDQASRLKSSLFGFKRKQNDEMDLNYYPNDHANAQLVPESHFGETGFIDEPFSAGPDGQVLPIFDEPAQTNALFETPNNSNGQWDEFAPSHIREQMAQQQSVPTQIDPLAEQQGRVQPRPAPLPQSARITREAQPSLPIGGVFELPAIALLSEPDIKSANQALPVEALEQNARLLEGVLEDFGVKGQIINVRPGPVVTMYELEPAPGIKSSRVIGLADDIARSMSAISARVAVVPGRNAIGIELPNAKRETVYLRELIASQDYEATKASLPLGLGKSIGGEPVVTDLAKTPHLLVAGTTGSGKSVSVNTMILSLLYKLDPSQCRMIMIDPKMLELSVYDGIPHLLTPVVTDPKKAVVALKWTVREMEERYKKMSKLGVRNITGYNNRIAEAKRKGEAITRTVQTGFDPDTAEAIYETEELQLEHMPFIVVIIDEMADLMMVAGKEIEGAVQRLAQMARAAGIHVIMATQRPSVDVITGTIKANFPSRISFSVTSKIDSRTILGEQGAEQLLGMGDMLFMAGGGKIQRVHGAFVDDDEVEKIVAHLKTQGVPEYLDAITIDDEDSGDGNGPSGTSNLAESDDPYDQAVAIVLRDGKASTSYVQRRMGIGYNRAATIIERMEEEGIISPANHAGKREILVPTESAQEDFVS